MTFDGFNEFIYRHGHTLSRRQIVVYRILNFNAKLQIKRFESEIFPFIYRILSEAVDLQRPSHRDIPIGRSGLKNHQQY
jgi:hypothetical protein